MPSPRKVARLRCVAGWSHMRTFIAGAISTGVSVANNRVEARSFATPLAILAIRSAVAGATTTRSATRLSWICPISASSPRSNKSRYSFCPANAETDKGVTNSSPARVSTGVTVAPRSRRRRIRSRDLKAAMPPPIISRICLPASMIAPVVGVRPDHRGAVHFPPARSCGRARRPRDHIWGLTLESGALRRIVSQAFCASCQRPRPLAGARVLSIGSARHPDFQASAADRAACVRAQ